MTVPPSPTSLSPLQARVAREIVAYIRRENLKAGEHLPEKLLADSIGTSRFPVSAALRYLADQDVLTHDANRGFFLNVDAVSLEDVQRLSGEPDDPLYLRIAQDRLRHQLPDSVNEADLMRLYGVTRNPLRKVLSRIQQEGWVVKSVGHGWEFQPLIDSPQAYEESYVFRIAIEPTGLLGEGFRATEEELGSLRRQQQAIVDRQYRTMTGFELFEANCLFHETLAKWSGNRFILQSVRRINQLRRLVEYQQALDREPRREQAAEHLAILDAVARHELPQAAALLRRHLEGARSNKVHHRNVFADEAQ